MGIFSSIKDAIFGKKAEAKPAAAPAATTTAAPAAAAPAPVAEEVDVDAVLTQLAADYGKPNNWRVSIVDLMTLLGIDSSLSNREELAQELGYTGKLGGSAEMNIWLHKAVMKELAANGGKVPAELLD